MDQLQTDVEAPDRQARRGRARHQPVDEARQVLLETALAQQPVEDRPQARAADDGGLISHSPPPQLLRGRCGTHAHLFLSLKTLISGRVYSIVSGAGDGCWW